MGSYNEAKEQMAIQGYFRRFAEEIALLQLVTGSEVFAGAHGDGVYVSPYFWSRQYGSHEPAKEQAYDDYFKTNAVMLQSYSQCKFCREEDRSGHHTVYIYCLPHIEITNKLGLIFPQHYTVEVACGHLSHHDMRGVCFRTFEDVIEYLVKFLG